VLHCQAESRDGEPGLDGSEGESYDRLSVSCVNAFPAASVYVCESEEVTVVDSQEHRRDLDLAQRAARGDEKAWRQLYDETCGPLFNILCFQVGDRDVAKDLLQETYLVAFRKLARYRGDGPLLAWLRTVALRRSLDWKRAVWRRLKGLRLLAAETEAAPGGAFNPERTTEARLDVRTRAFRKALRQLSRNQRAALLLHELEGLSFTEIAATLGCGEATARVHCHRARASMRQFLNSEQDLALADEMGGQQA
jgi:RNA polymerase sigma factor (sigma-70 family)